MLLIYGLWMVQRSKTGTESELFAIHFGLRGYLADCDQELMNSQDEFYKARCRNHRAIERAEQISSNLL